MLSNPPFGVEWKKIEQEITSEYERLGFAGRFGAGLPRISDDSFLFLQHMISKMRPEDGGARLGIVFNGSPLFSGRAGSGESEIRKWIIEKDMLEAILKALSERDETADICVDKDGKPEADPDLRDYENVPLMPARRSRSASGDNIDEYFKREVLPHVPDAWMDRSKDKIGYEINFTKEFYKYKPLRNLEDIRKDILALEKETEGLLTEVLE